MGAEYSTAYADNIADIKRLLKHIFLRQWHPCAHKAEYGRLYLHIHKAGFAVAADGHNTACHAYNGFIGSKSSNFD